MAIVRVEIGRDGLLRGTTLARSSGYSALDDSAVSMIREIKLPNIPHELREHAFSVDIPFQYSLRQQAVGVDGAGVVPVRRVQ